VIYTRYPRAFASALPQDGEPGLIALLVPAWDESAVIASMLRATIERVDYADYRIFAGYYRNDPATAAAIASIADTRVEAVQIDRDGPTTKADCLNHLYDALVAYENDSGRGAKAVVLHDAEDVVHPLELRIFDRLIDRAAVIQLPVLPLPDPHSRWISGH
jgi:adsorption protein B